MASTVCSSAPPSKAPKMAHARQPTIPPHPLDAPARLAVVTEHVTSSSTSEANSGFPSPFAVTGPATPPSASAAQGCGASASTLSSTREHEADAAKHATAPTTLTTAAIPITTTAAQHDALPDGGSGGEDKDVVAALSALRQEVRALRVENSVLRQRVAILTAAPPTASSSSLPPSTYDRMSTAQGEAETTSQGISTSSSPSAPLLLAQVRRLEAALSLEVIEREALERRVLAQEGVLLSLQLEKQQRRMERGA